MCGGIFDKTTHWLKHCYRDRDIHYIGSDMHNLTSRPPIDAESVKWCAKLPDDYRNLLLHDNAEFMFS